MLQASNDKREQDMPEGLVSHKTGEVDLHKSYSSIILKVYTVPLLSQSCSKYSSAGKSFIYTASRVWLILACSLRYAAMQLATSVYHHR